MSCVCVGANGVGGVVPNAVAASFIFTQLLLLLLGFRFWQLNAATEGVGEGVATQLSNVLHSQHVPHKPLILLLEKRFLANCLPNSTFRRWERELPAPKMTLMEGSVICPWSKRGPSCGEMGPYFWGEINVSHEFSTGYPSCGAVR